MNKIITVDDYDGEDITLLIEDSVAVRAITQELFEFDDDGERYVEIELSFEDWGDSDE